MRNTIRGGFLVLCLALPCIARAAGAPPPDKPIDMGRFFTGRWYEIARTPMRLTTGCVAGTTDYLRGADGTLIDRDACRMGTPEGQEKAYQGPVSILDPPANNEVSVRYTLYGVVFVTRAYWMLDHGADYRWFIVANPAFTQVSIFTRSPRPGRQLIASLAARVRALGYHGEKLEYPAQFPEEGER